MSLFRWSGNILLLCVAMVSLSSGGCQQGDRKSADQQAKAKDAAEKKDGLHDEWWCQEHGIPEDMCSLCSASAAAKAKKEGDWCKIHGRAQSQCFKCDPSKYKKFEDMYVAKYNKKPERPPEEEFKK